MSAVGFLQRVCLDDGLTSRCKCSLTSKMVRAPPSGWIQTLQSEMEPLHVAVSSPKSSKISACFTQTDVFIAMELMGTCAEKLKKRIQGPIPERILGKMTVAVS